MAWLGNEYLYVAVCKYATRRRDDVDRVARAYGEGVRGGFNYCSR